MDGLSTAFKSSSKEEWLERASLELKGRPIQSLDNPNLSLSPSPFYHREDLSAQHSGPILPVRSNTWQIVEKFSIPESNLNAQILNGLTNGVEILWLKCGHEVPLDLSQILAGVHLNMVEVILEGPAITASAHGILDKLAKDYPGYSPSVNIRMLVSPINYLALSSDDKLLALPWAGYNTSSNGAVLDTLAEILMECQPLYDAKELPVGSLITLTTRDNYFDSVCQIRALRLLLQHLSILHFGRLDKVPTIQAELSLSYDTPHDNMIALTAQAKAAAIGGADRIWVPPSGVKAQPGSTYRRISRNLHHLMKMESNIDEVSDPVAGSYFFETYTNKIAHGAWELFTQKIEADGRD